MSFREARIKSGKKVADVVELLGVTDAAVYQWETGVTKPRTAFLLKLAKFYGCSVDDLLREDYGGDNNGETCC